MGKLQKDEAFYKKLWSLMVPIVLQNLMLAMVAVADAFMLGGMDQNYMSAVSLATQIQFIQNMFLAAATASLGILGAQYWGKGDKKTLDEIFCMALRLCGLVSAIFFVGCVFFGRYLMLIFTNEEVLINYGVSYLKIAGFSYLLTGISQCYLVIMKTSEHAKTTAVISSMTVCVNIILMPFLFLEALALHRWVCAEQLLRHLSRELLSFAVLYLFHISQIIYIRPCVIY